MLSIENPHRSSGIIDPHLQYRRRRRTACPCIARPLRICGIRNRRQLRQVPRCSNHRTENVGLCAGRNAETGILVAPDQSAYGMCCISVRLASYRLSEIGGNSRGTFQKTTCFLALNQPAPFRPTQQPIRGVPGGISPQCWRSAPRLSCGRAAEKSASSTDRVSGVFASRSSPQKRWFTRCRQIDTGKVRKWVSPKVRTNPTRATPSLSPPFLESLPRPACSLSTVPTSRRVPCIQSPATRVKTL